MSILKTQEHVLWDCIYHVVIVPKYRKKILYLHTRKEIGAIIRTLAKRKGIEIIEGNAQVDHIHMVISIPPKFSVANTMGFIKEKAPSSFTINSEKEIETSCKKVSGVEVTLSER